MNIQLIKKILNRIALVTIILIFGAFIWVDYELTGMYGEHVKVVDSSQFKRQIATIAITHVNVLSADGQNMLKDKTVVIKDCKINAIGNIEDLSNNITIIDGKGKYLIPGLIDSHAHLNGSQNDLLLYIANGVTTIREMKGDENILSWRDEIKNGRVGPTIYMTTRKINTYGLLEGWIKEWTRHELNLKKPKDAKPMIQTLADEGYDAIKIDTFLSNENYHAISQATKEIGITLIGHIPLDVTLKEVWQSNQKEIAHVEEIFKALDREFGYWESKKSPDFLPFVKKRSKQIAKNLFKHKIKVTTTLWLMESILRQQEDLVSVLKSIQLSYANPGITEGTVLTSRGLGWLPKVNPFRYAENISPKKRTEHIAYEKQKVQALYILLKDMLQESVTILAGTDTTTPVVIAGFSMHDELQSLVNSIMTPVQALASATRLPADWMKVKTGRIAEGYQADLLLLNKNPLKNIANTKSINTVIANGKVFNRKILDAMLAAVKKANDESREVNIDNLK